MCVGGGTGVDPRGLRLSRVPPIPPMPPAPPVPHRLACVEATQRLCGSHTRAVAVPQQHIVAVEKPQQLCWLYKEAICCSYKVYMPVKHARIRPENIDSGTNGVGKPPFGLKRCPVRAVHLRMPPACLDCKKNSKIRQKTSFLATFGPGPYFPPISRCGMRCRDCAKRILRL